MWKLDPKEGWALKNWCFQIVVLEKTLESPLACKEIKPVNPQGSQPWIFIGRTDAKVEGPLLWHMMPRADSLEKTLMLGKIEGRRTDSMGMNLSKLWEIVKDRGAWCAAVHEVGRVRHNLATGEQQLFGGYFQWDDWPKLLHHYH